MSIDRFIGRHRLASLLVALHTLMVGAFVWIELNHAWNDMNPTMLVMAALHVFDYPVNAVLQPLINSAENLGTYLAALLVLGGVFWFIVGTLITFAWQLIIRTNAMRMLHSHPHR